MFRPLPVPDAQSFKRVSMQTRGEGSRSTPWHTRSLYRQPSSATSVTTRSPPMSPPLSQATLSCACADDGRLNAAVGLGRSCLLCFLERRPLWAGSLHRQEVTSPSDPQPWRCWRGRRGCVISSNRPDIVGRSFLMNRTPFTVIGVAESRRGRPPCDSGRRVDPVHDACRDTAGRASVREPQTLAGFDVCTTPTWRQRHHDAG